MAMNDLSARDERLLAACLAGLPGDVVQHSLAKLGDASRKSVLAQMDIFLKRFDAPIWSQVITSNVVRELRAIALSPEDALSSHHEVVKQTMKSLREKNVMGPKAFESLSRTLSAAPELLDVT